MKVLVTGHDGYIGAVLVPYLQRAGLEVRGLDSYLFEACAFGAARPTVPALRVDLRDVEPADLDGFDAVVHLAALSNDPLGDLDAGDHLRDQPSRRGPPRAARPRGRRRALRLLLVLQPLRRRRRGGG